MKNLNEKIAGESKETQSKLQEILEGRFKLNQNDQIINLGDIVTLLQVWGSCNGCIPDFDDNGIINLADLNHLLLNWNSICPED